MQLFRTSYHPETLGADCANCPFRRDNFRPVPPEVSPSITPKGILLGDVPSNSDHYHLRPITGKAGECFDAALEAEGVSRRQFHVLHAVACRPLYPATDSRIGRAVKCCAPRLKQELERYGSKLPILALGKWAKKSLLDRNNARYAQGIQIEVDERSILAAPHPYVAYEAAPQNHVILETYLRRYLQRIRGVKPMTWPQLHLQANEEAVSALEKIAKASRVGFDVETLGANPLTDLITCFGLSDGVNTISVPWDSYTTTKHGYVAGIDTYGSIGARIRELCLQIIADPNIEISTQNGQYDVLTMRARGHHVENNFDTMLAHWVCYPQLPHGLEHIAVQLIDLPSRWKTEFHKSDEDLKGSLIYEEADPLILRDYNAKDSLVTQWLQTILTVELEDVYQGWDHFNRRMAIARIAMTSYEAGWPVDLEKVQEFGVLFQGIIDKEEAQLAKLLKEVGMPELNPDSPAQLQELFYEVLDEPVTFYTPAGAPATNKKARAVFKDSANPYSSALADVLDDRKKFTKLKEAYVDNVTGPLVRPAAKVHGTLSGRWSYPKPALQTTPAKVKPMFVAHEGEYLVACDYGALEGRLIALYAGDDVLLEAFANNQDVHRINAGGLFRKAPQDIVAEQRQAAKLFMFNINYSSTNVEQCAKGMHAVLKAKFPEFTYQHVYALCQAWWESHPAIHDWRMNIQQFIRKFDYVEEPLSGWRRYFHNKPKETEAFNFIPQSGGSFCADTALINIAAELRPEDKFLLQRHDELVFCTPDPIRVAGLMWKHMARRLELNGKWVDLTLDGWITRRWGTYDATGTSLAELTTNFSKFKESSC